MFYGVIVRTFWMTLVYMNFNIYLDETAESFATAKEDSLLTSSDAGYTEDSQEPLDDR